MPPKKEELKVHIWHLMLWEFRNLKNTTKTAKKIFSAYDQVIIMDCQVPNCFSKFCSGDTSLRHEPRLTYSSDLNKDVKEN